MRRANQFLFLTFFFLFFTIDAFAENQSFHHSHWIHPEYLKLSPRIIAVMPMDNYSLEPEVERILFEEVYRQLLSRGYQKIEKKYVFDVMNQLGIQTPGQLAAIPMEKLCGQLQCDGLLSGEINQSSAIHQVAYDAIVVSCSLRLRHCRSGKIIWETEQWRTAHRQWAIDPFNILINIAQHEKAPREDRIAFLVEKMLSTLPRGPIHLDTEELLKKANIQITATPTGDHSDED
ncbi:MAG: hypothetical protein A2V65_02120 [Deltaproteobacteria bacterium RBG_13_49_15]|nr:MAG: hypothetical protein A2V65_02120 [Deltaproteobacteria bacterium RBG_13_49_15]